MKRAIKAMVVGSVYHQQRNLIETLSEMSDTEAVWYVTSGEEAINLYPVLDPDIVFIDIILTGMTGLETAKWIKEQDNTIKILILSHELNNVFLHAGIDAGLDGYLRKDMGKSALQEAIKKVVNGNSHFEYS